MATVLAVDDSPSIRQMIKVVLGPAGHTVIEAGDGAEGLAKARSESVNLVITDLNMPVMNGLEMIKQLRTLPSFTGVPILFLSTESDEGIKQQAKAAGATGWITKPFKPEQLLAVVGKLVRA
ncbi:response regulator [Methylobacterium radiotolerans]|uniref:Response regulator receiver protein n=1 Tax=Methylobacterium radiotolerans (strain ATCC 27329 / DSM 1819 / JCM 2831 / NBRC 15690 / NCIMB 10815 / 0-1) TaxID=426355 RepID=B1M851_METRJ|nr:response regulator [Methylobacterium radiotolerans]MCX4197439.1 response regulator [Methylobacterium organophilum]ACB26772.1 response regulator receiver protein [Methylobacterium radiotolerans JCM 2831]KIU28634.1 chemotaxis protein CheY [Methylobacterium radiotolerans]KTS08286.1 chemotaxis protein CheY [Methylobacterium radiotolerans]KTS43753.1 chemotaxis protein CheY [Methylobacterium radiotolerans]